MSFVQLKQVGEALNKYYGFPYEAYRAGRSIPRVPKPSARQFVETHEWLVIESSDERIHVLCTDPEELVEHAIIESFFPNITIIQRHDPSRLSSNCSDFCGI